MILYCILVFIKKTISVIKNITIIKSTKLIASIIYSISSVIGVLITKIVVEVDYLSAIIITLIFSFLGCYISMYICDKFINNGRKN